MRRFIAHIDVFIYFDLFLETMSGNKGMTLREVLIMTKCGAKAHQYARRKKLVSGSLNIMDFTRRPMSQQILMALTINGACSNILEAALFKWKMGK